MAITRSAKKAIRTSLRRRVFNMRRKNTLQATSKAFLQAIAAHDMAGAEKMLPAAYKAIDKAKKRGVIRTNTAARKKARLAALLKRTRA